MPRDICLGHDLRDPKVQDKVLDEIARERPWLLWAAPPCTEWCAFARLSHDPQERRRGQKREVAFLKFLDRGFDLQESLGGHIAVENPWTSELWQHPISRR